MCDLACKRAKYVVFAQVTPVATPSGIVEGGLIAVISDSK